MAGLDTDCLDCFKSVCSLNLVLLFGDELLPQEVRRLDGQAVLAAVIDDTRAGCHRSHSLSTFYSRAGLPAFLLLVREVYLVFCIIVAHGLGSWRTANDCNPTLA